MVGARPACTAFCCFSSLEKNFWAWLRIWTAVLVLTWPARQRRGRGGAVSWGGHWQQRGVQVQERCRRCIKRRPVLPASSRHALSILRHCLPWRRSASTKRSCSSSVHRSRCLVMV